MKKDAQKIQLTLKICVFFFQNLKLNEKIFYFLKHFGLNEMLNVFIYVKYKVSINGLVSLDGVYLLGS